MKNDATTAPPEGSAYPEPTEAMRLAFTATRGSWFDKMRAALAVAAVGGVPAERHVRHLKRGSVYAVLGEATAQVSKPTHDVLTIGAHRRLHDGDLVVVYVGADGQLWVRFPDEMSDGRFEMIAPTEDPTADEGPDAIEDWADRLAGHVLGSHCACYAEAWPSHTCDTERFNAAMLVRSFFAASGLAVVPREPTVGMIEAAIRALRLTKRGTEEAVKLARLVGGPHEPGCAVTIRAAIAAGEKEAAR